MPGGVRGDGGEVLVEKQGARAAEKEAAKVARAAKKAAAVAAKEAERQAGAVAAGRVAVVS